MIHSHLPTINYIGDSISKPPILDKANLIQQLIKKLLIYIQKG